MAKAKTTGAKGSKPKGGVKGAKDRPYKAIAFRVYQAYAEWLEDCAARDRSTVAALLDRAVTAYAKDQGWPEPPPRV